MNTLRNLAAKLASQPYINPLRYLARRIDAAAISLSAAVLVAAGRGEEEALQIAERLFDGALAGSEN